VLHLTANDNLLCNINVPTSSHLQSEFQVQDGRINALEIASNNLHHELQRKIMALESTVQQMSAQLIIFQERINRITMTRPTDLEFAFREGCSGSPFDCSLHTMLERIMNDEIMEQSNTRRDLNLRGLDQFDNEAQRHPAGTNKELMTNTPLRRTARKHRGITDENNHEQPQVLGQEALQRSTAQDEPERREEVASFQYYRNFSNQRSNTHHIPTDGRNAGLVNNNVLCYANAIFQIIASCGCLNESLSNPLSTRLRRNVGRNGHNFRKNGVTRFFS
jgi:hypothetical protein